MRLRKEYENVFSDVPGKAVVEDFQIELEDGAKPFKYHPHSLPDTLKNGVKEKIKNLQELGITKPSKSPWVSPIVPVVQAEETLQKRTSEDTEH